MKSYIGLSISIRSEKLQPILRCFLLCLLLFLFLPAQADSSGIVSFHASYDIFRNDKQFGEAILQAEKKNNSIRMHMITKPGGLFAIITSHKPYTETLLNRSHGDFRLSSVNISSDINADPLEIAEFDWQQSLLTAKRKNKQRQIPLTEAVYDYLSIHWLSAQLILAEADQYQLKFYRKGKLMTSTLLHTGRETLELAGEKIETSVFQQTFKGSSRQIKYHYDLRNPWLPVRIERTKKGKKKTVLLLNALQDRL